MSAETPATDPHEQDLELEPLDPGELELQPNEEPEQLEFSPAPEPEHSRSAPTSE